MVLPSPSALRSLCEAPFVLFDPACGPARWYSRPHAHRLAHDAAQARALIAWIAEELAAGRELALFVAFEAAQALAGLPPLHAPITPLVEALSFTHAQALTAEQVQQLLASPPGADQPAGFLRWRTSLSRLRYDEALDRIGAYLRAGHSYQIDYTFALHGRAFGTPTALYARLRSQQPTAHRCFARLQRRWVLSLSPELFFALEPGGRITARPMKGTAPRAVDPARDAQLAAALAADPKNRAENLMILDLLRNDLGRIAQPGSVRVPQAFTVEPYPRVWQMTSTVQAQLRALVDWPALWAALFPCGSVVGAPKHRSLEIIRELEPHARGLYTGAIGWIAPAAHEGAPPGSPRAARACFSVAIRTLELSEPPRRGTRAVRLGVGSGVVADSHAATEWAECQLKARFARALDPGFALIETFAARYPEQRSVIEPHLRRLARSARALGFACDLRALRARLANAHRAQPAAHAWPWGQRTRLCLYADGRIEIHLEPVRDWDAPGPLPIVLAPAALVLDPDDPLLRHKTTRRGIYDAAWRWAQSQGAFDALLFNRRGELCEGGRSNVFVKLEGRWHTPPLSCGVLPGVTRARLLADPAWDTRETVLVRADVLRAEALLLTNAVRGVRSATWLAAAHPARLAHR
jgi:para-aminobenzoate synthetase/4-amino-4-deoxychorismate lyase